MWKVLSWILIVLPFIEGHQRCPDGFEKVKNKCYHFSKDLATFNNAHFTCKENWNGTLVILKGKQQNEALKHHLTKFLSKEEERWLGAIYDWKQKHWTWSVGGEDMKYHDFGKLPSKNDLIWHCAIFDPKQQYRWSAKKCTESKRYICQLTQTKSKKQNVQSNGNNPGNTWINNRVGSSAPGHLKTKSKRPVKIEKSPACPEPFLKVRQSCFFFSNAMATWQDAFFQCKDLHNATLAVITNLKDDLGLMNKVNKFVISYDDRWLGGRYDWKQHHWIWEHNGKKINYQTKETHNLEWYCLTWNPKVTDRPRLDADKCFKLKRFICQTPAQHKKKLKKN